MDEKTYLLTWAKHLFKSRDAMLKKIKEIKEHKDMLIIEYKDMSKTAVFGCPQLASFKGLDLSDDIKYAIITFNTEDNFNALISGWAALSSHPKLTIYFINPKSAHDKRWVIHPCVHARIADPESLNSGLRTMFDAVESLDASQTKTLIKSELF